MAEPLTNEELDQVIQAFRQAEGNKTLAARLLNMGRDKFRHRFDQALERRNICVDEILGGGNLLGVQTKRLGSPTSGKIKRYIVTSAQNNTRLWEGWNNILALADHYDAEVLVGTFSYSFNGYGPQSVKRGTKSRIKVSHDVWWDAALEPYLRDERLELAPGLIWDGVMNILPSAVDPLSGLESHLHRSSVIFPHVTHELRSVASGRHEAAKLQFTTGTVTQRNYLQKKAGLKAEQFHRYGALLVEVDHRGNWFVRQLQGGPDDEIYDLDVRVQAGKVSTGHRVEAITWGDVHLDNADNMTHELAWGEGGMLDVLRPRYQFIHDVLDFRRRNHHDLKNFHEQYWKWARGQEDVRGEVADVAHFLGETSYRKGTTSYVVDSNHDRALQRWLWEQDYRQDPINAEFFLETQLAMVRALKMDNDKFHLLQHVCQQNGLDKSLDVTFLHRDQSIVLCRDIDDGIEGGMHGDEGTNGSKGNIRSFVKMGRRANIAHAHSAEIRRSIYLCGTSSTLSPRWAHGPSSWSSSHTVTYPNSTRAMVTMWDNNWRA